MGKGMSFGKALDWLKEKGGAVTRRNWYGSDASPRVKIQRPDENSFMTEPYLYMEKFAASGKKIRFPLDLSRESILADDWVIVEAVGE